MSNPTDLVAAMAGQVQYAGSEPVHQEQVAPTATFIEEVTATEEVAPEEAVDSKLSVQLLANRNRDLINFATQPHFLGSWNWTTLTTFTGAGGQFQSTVIADVLGHTRLSERLRGFAGFKCTVVYRFEVTASPTQAGMCRVVYIPNLELFPEREAMHTKHRIPFSQLPGVDITCRDQAVELKIPYISPTRFHKFSADSPGHGKYMLDIIEQLRTGTNGPTGVTIARWMMVEDLEVFGAENVVFQSSRRTRKLPSENEGPPLSSILDAGAQLVHQVGRVPLMSSFTGTPEWALRAGAKTARCFGYSKPLSSGDVTKVTTARYAGTATADGKDCSEPLSVNYDAKLRTIDLGYNDGLDPMSIDFIKRQWSFLRDGTITAGTGAFLTHTVAPNYKEIVSGPIKALTPLAWLTGMTAYWRGSIEFRMVFLTTEYHRCKLVVSYSPSGTVPATVADTTTLLRWEVDLATTNELCFTIPWWDDDDWKHRVDDLGVFTLNVTNSLRNPETVSGTVDYVLYVRGGPDFEVQVPGFTFEKPVVFQSSSQPRGVDGALSTMSLAPSMDSMGEQIGSVLQLLKQYRPMAMNASSVTKRAISFSPWITAGQQFVGGTPALVNNAAVETTLWSYICAPYAYYRGGVRLRANPSPFVVNPIDGTTVNNKAAVCGFMKSYTGYNASSTLRLSSSDWSSSSNPIVSCNFAAGGYTGEPLITGDVYREQVSVQVPYQAARRFAPVKFQTPTNTTLSLFEPRTVVTFFTDGCGCAFVSRAAADDYQLMCWLGVPVMAAY